jgi:arginyl-tRNA synthetase
MQIKQQIEGKILEVLKELGVENPVVVLERPADMVNGDYSTNVALVYGKTLSKNPKAFADEIVEILKQVQDDTEVSVAGPGFINFHLSKDFYTNEIKNILDKSESYGKGEVLSGKKVMVEYTQPNPFKPFHIGHLMSNAIGESLSRIVAWQGAKVVRANYQGDIGLHVAKAIWGIVKGGGEYPKGSVAEVAEYIGKCYSDASNEYETNEDIKKEIDAINKRLYQKDAEFWPLYEEGRKITLEAFEELYKMLGTKFDEYYFESEMAEVGAKLVREYKEKGVFEDSDGAIVFHGEKYNPKLHTRVFLTSAGLPPYEAKEIGLTVKKFTTHNPDISIVDTATEQKEYMAVVTEAIRQMFPEEKYADRMVHVTHGMMRFASGKMSSRKGNVVTGESLIRDTVDLILQKMTERDWSEEEKKNISEMVGVSAIKYSILRSRIGSDIVYDFEKSISIDGDSGPYLQYSLVRAKSLLEKGKREGLSCASFELPADWNTTTLEKLLVRFSETTLRAWDDLEPHHLVTYLTELASAFNSFYADGKIVDASDSHSPYKLALTQAFSTVMESGLNLVGIKVPERM